MDLDVGPVVYLDCRTPQEQVIERDALAHSDAALATEPPQAPIEALPEHWFDVPGEVRENVFALLQVFPSGDFYYECVPMLMSLGPVTLCHNATSCISSIEAFMHTLHRSEAITTIIDVLDDEARARAEAWKTSELPSSATAKDETQDEDEELATLYGCSLVEHLEACISDQRMSDSLVVIAAVRNSKFVGGRSAAKDDGLLTITPRIQTTLLDAGAVDVLTGVFTLERIQSLASYAYRIARGSTQHASALSRKQRRSRSWVGINESKPYSYLREKMVSGLMARICNPDYREDEIDTAEYEISDERKQAVASVIGSWEFSAHNFTDDELMHGCLLMLEHTLKLEELAKWRMSTEQIFTFLVACRRVYNAFVLYHNFRHACDVMQAVFHFLIRNGIIPPFGDNASLAPPVKSALAALLKPFHALTLIISAIGHDVGHPGVNNAFLVTLNAPLAQLYNDRSVLEAFHCAAFSQLLRRYWPVAFSDIAMRKLMITSILATDMGLHGTYMTQMGNLHEKFAHNNYSVDGWNVQTMEEYKDLLCCLLIKCADICNVARKLECSDEWTRIITSEFAHQGQMEIDLHIPTCLFGGPPDQNDVIKITNGQLGFMNIFASPLFEGVAQILPDMRFCSDEIEANRVSYQELVAKESKRRSRAVNMSEGSASPRTQRSISDFHSPKEEKHVHSHLSMMDTLSPSSKDDESPPIMSSHQSPPAGGGIGPASQPSYDTSRRASLGPVSVPENSSPDDSRRPSIREI